jgi:hypothetical protein
MRAYLVGDDATHAGQAAAARAITAAATAGPSGGPGRPPARRSRRKQPNADAADAEHATETDTETATQSPFLGEPAGQGVPRSAVISPLGSAQTEHGWPPPAADLTALGESQSLPSATVGLFGSIESRLVAEGTEPDPITPGPSDSLWDRCPWLDDLRDVPKDASWPRLMTGPHPQAVDSYGAEATKWLREATGLRLRWWQELWITRALEHDDAGDLVWIDDLTSTARQVGKSVGIRGIALWRLHQAERFGGEQLVLHTGKDLPVCKEVQRPARVWARARNGYGVRESNGSEEISTDDGSRWLVRGKGSVYGYAASVGLVDEAWGVAPEVVEDGIEPTLGDRCSAQLWLISTAHRRASSLMPLRRATAIGEMAEPSTTLLIEWSAPRTASIDDREAWRLASPHWTPNRARLLESKLRRAERGVSDDPDEDDPVEAFRSQWLNIWPARREALTGRDEPLLTAPELWPAASDLYAELPERLYIAVEDWFGIGAAAAVAGVMDDGRILVSGATFHDRGEACAWAAWMARSHPHSVLLLGASIADDEAVVQIDVASTETRGRAETRQALPKVRELVNAGRVMHDGGTELTTQVIGMRVLPGSEGGLSVSPRSPRSDLARAAAWAVHAVANQPVPLPFFVH